MKHIIFTFLLFCVVIMASCRKDKSEPTIKDYDQQEMQTYISANGLSTVMQRDLSGGDTTGMYYQILSAGNGAVVDYPDKVSLVYSMRSFDGKFLNTDTIVNHTYDFVGHLTTAYNPYLSKGAMLGIVNILKKKGGRMRLLVPSHLAFGANGAGTGSSDGNNRVAGNQGIDYYFNLINDQKKYDDLSITNYKTANNLTGFTATGTGLWYKITQAGVPNYNITKSSIVEIQYTSYLMNNALTSDQYNTATGTGLSVDLTSDTRAGLVEGLQHGSVGAKMTLLIPSYLAYGTAALSDGTVPANSCLRYDINILSVQ